MSYPYFEFYGNYDMTWSFSVKFSVLISLSNSLRSLCLWKTVRINKIYFFNNINAAFYIEHYDYKDCLRQKRYVVKIPWSLPPYIFLKIFSISDPFWYKKKKKLVKDEENPYFSQSSYVFANIYFPNIVLPLFYRVSLFATHPCMHSQIIHSSLSILAFSIFFTPTFYHSSFFCLFNFFLSSSIPATTSLINVSIVYFFSYPSPLLNMPKREIQFFFFFISQAYLFIRTRFFPPQSKLVTRKSLWRSSDSKSFQHYTNLLNNTQISSLFS